MCVSVRVRWLFVVTGFFSSQESETPKMAGVDWRDAHIDWRRSLVFLSYLGTYGHAEEMGPKKIIIPLLYLFLKLYPAHWRVRE